MEPIRMATPEEIEAIRTGSEITPLTRVLVCGKQIAVLRPALELDPVIYDGGTGQRAAFIWGIEGILRATGAETYYFNIPANEEMAQYRNQVEKWGATQVSKEPEFRYRKVL